MPCKGGCDGIYNPNCDIQRYCLKCARWYHVHSLKSLDHVPRPDELGLSNLPDGLPQDFLHVAMRPIERGGMVSGISGNGTVQMQLRRLLEQGDEEDIENWKSTLGNALIDDATPLQPAYFMCDECSGIL